MGKLVPKPKCPTCNCRAADDLVRIPVPKFKMSSSTKKALYYGFIVLVIVEASRLAFVMGRIFSSESAKDISLIGMVILFITNFFWIVAALVLLDGSIPVFISGLLYCIFSGGIIVGIVMYGDANFTSIRSPAIANTN